MLDTTSTPVRIQHPAPSPGRSQEPRDPVVVVSFLALAIYVVVDAFLAPEPGASRVEHLPGAALALAVLGLLVAFDARLRRGVRAAVLVVVGALALVRAVLGLAEILERGAGAADWTALLLFPAGAALLVVGVRDAWRSRRGGRRAWGRRALVAVAALVAAYWLVYPAAMSIVATEKPRAAVEQAELGHPYEEVSLRTADGLELAGWYVPSENGAAVIAFPGRSQPVPHARMLVRHGYGVLLLDMRGQGDSEGDPNAFGWESAKDVDAAVAFLRDRLDVREGAIGGLGLSVGGELLVEAAAQNPGLRAVVSEGAGLRSVRETFARQDVPAVQVWLQAPAEAVLTATTAVLSADPPPASLEDLSAQVAPRPILFVYGEEGQETERALTPAYAAAAGPTAELWEVPGAGHTGGLEAQPEEYERRVIEFFDDALLGR